MFSGRLYAYRDRFIAKEIGGGFPGEGDDKGKYCRVMKSVDVSEESEIEKVWDVAVVFLSRVRCFWLVSFSQNLWLWASLTPGAR